MSEQKKQRQSLRFRLAIPDRVGYRMVAVDVAKLDRGWQFPDNCYIGPDGSGATAGRIELFEGWLSEHSGESILVPTVYLSDKRNRVRFHDGRHRFAVLRDRGYRTVKVGVPRGQVGRFRKHFAPDVRRSPIKRKT